MDFFLKLMKALANETRLDIIQHLIEDKQLSLEDIVKCINRPYKTIAGHLKILERSGLLKSHRWKGEVLYSLNASSTMYYNRQLVGLVRRRIRRK